MIGEENTELSLKLQCREETVSFKNPYDPKRGSLFCFRTLSETATTTYRNGRDMVSTPLEEKTELETSSGNLIAASCAFVKREISDMDAVSCRGGREESDDIIRLETPRKKLRLSKYQSSILEESFREHSALTPKHKSTLANKLNLQPRQVEVWFQNRRARKKLKRKDVEYENLKLCYESLREENRRLEREVQALRAMETAQNLYRQSPNSMPSAATALTMYPSCDQCLATKNTSATITS